MNTKILGVESAPGRITYGTFDVDGVPIPLVLAAGRGDGPTLTIHCAQHSTEFSGSAMIGLLLAELDLSALRGTVATVPLSNMPFISRVRLPDSYQRIADSLAPLPKERANPNRNWPGKRDGTWTDKLTWTLSHELFARSAAVLDYHSCRLCDPDFAGYLAGHEASRAIALACGFEVACEDPFEGPMGGQLHRHVPRQVGVPAVIIEMSPTASQVNWEATLRAKRAAINVMRHLGMLGGKPELPARQLVSHRFSRQHSIRTSRPGFVCMHRRPAALVEQGDLIGELRSVTDFSVIEEYRAPEAGGLISCGPHPSHFALAGEELATLQPGVEVIDNAT